MTGYRLLGIDPGDVVTGWVIVDERLRVLGAGNTPNRDFRDCTLLPHLAGRDPVAIETVSSYGMRVGSTVFETCRWTGRYQERCEMAGVDPVMLHRPGIKTHILGKATGNDAAVRAALLRRFAGPQDGPHGRGTKARPGWFAGVTSHAWQAYAVAVTAADLHLNR